MNHVAGPNSVAELLLVVVALAVVILSFYLAVRYTFWPGERSPNHIKRRVLGDNDEDR